MVNRQLDRLAQREQDLHQRGEQLEASRASLEVERRDLRRLTSEARMRLESAAKLDSTEARTLLLREVERESARDADLSRRLLEAARQRRNRKPGEFWRLPSSGARPLIPSRPQRPRWR